MREAGSAGKAPRARHASCHSDAAATVRHACERRSSARSGRAASSTARRPTGRARTDVASASCSDIGHSTARASALRADLRWLRRRIAIDARRRVARHRIDSPEGSRLGGARDSWSAAARSARNAPRFSPRPSRPPPPRRAASGCPCERPAPTEAPVGLSAPPRVIGATRRATTSPPPRGGAAGTGGGSRGGGGGARRSSPSAASSAVSARAECSRRGRRGICQHAKDSVRLSVARTPRKPVGLSAERSRVSPSDSACDNAARRRPPPPPPPPPRPPPLRRRLVNRRLSIPDRACACERRLLRRGVRAVRADRLRDEATASRGKRRCSPSCCARRLERQPLGFASARACAPPLTVPAADPSRPGATCVRARAPPPPPCRMSRCTCRP